MTRLLASAAGAALILAIASTSPASAGASGLKVVATIPGPDGGWDYASFDPARRRLYVAHGSDVLSVDSATGKVTPSVAAGSHLHAVVPLPGGKILVTTNSGDNTAKVVSAADGRLIASVPTAKDADSAIFDPASGLVIVVGGDAGEITLVDPKAGKAVGSIPVGGKLEFLAVDGKGDLFVNDEEKAEVVRIDFAARKV
ncbi:MAG: PQQ-binding-like beta-propeller repeat protein, partial [Caulobacteraceae bacterium]|nr:PQQ-binding-like beta-propeller repeat protein [Caulobacteraceae bacterium]